MGSPPPPDAPPPAQQDLVEADAGFSTAGPPAASLCGISLVLPTFHFNFAINLQLPAFPPTFLLNFALQLNCDLDNPLDISAGVAVGGGRKSTTDPDPDDVF